MGSTQRAFKVYLPEEEAVELEDLAASEDRKLTSMVRVLLREALAQRRKRRRR